MESHLRPVSYTQLDVYKRQVQGEAGGAIVVDCGEIDAGCADEIVQCALFGEVIYG